MLVRADGAALPGVLSADKLRAWLRAAPTPAPAALR